MSLLLLFGSPPAGSTPVSALLFKVNGRDLTTYTQTQPDAGFEPGNNPLEPQFGGSSAFGEGLVWVSDSVGAQEWHVPLLLTAGSQDALNLLIQNINNDLFQGAVVEFTPDGATNSTFRALERGKLEVAYDESLYRHGYAKAVLQLWTKPYGHTGTSRWVASMVTGTGVLTFPVTGVLGDVKAIGNLTVQVGSGIPPLLFNPVSHCIWAVTRGNPSPVRNASYLVANNGGITGATAIGASGRTASTYYGITISPAPYTGPIANVYLTATNTETLQGRHRVFMSYQASIVGSMLAFRMRLVDSASKYTETPTVIGGIFLNRYQTIDLGEVTLPVTPSGAAGATWSLQPCLYMPSYNVSTATPNFRIDSLVFIPVEDSVGIIGGMSGVLGQRMFQHLNGYPTQRAWAGSTTYAVGTDEPLSGDQYPQVPPTGSPVASTLTAIVWPIFQTAHLGNDLVAASLGVNERFRFMR